MQSPKYVSLLFAAAATCLIAGCSTAPKSTSERNALENRSNSALSEMKSNDASLDGFLRNSYGYAIFPSVGKGGLIVGGGYGRGEVYEQGKFIGFADITQATVGLQAGGQSFSELIVFQNKEALDNFRYGKVKFTANASAVAIKAGASTAANYSHGVAIFTMAQGGLMAEAAVGGQEFGFVPATDADMQRHNDMQNAHGRTNADLAQPAGTTDRTVTEKFSPATRPATPTD